MLCILNLQIPFLSIFKTEILLMCFLIHTTTLWQNTIILGAVPNSNTWIDTLFFFFDKFSANCFWHHSALRINSCWKRCYSKTEWHQTVIVKKETSGTLTISGISQDNDVWLRILVLMSLSLLWLLNKWFSLC